MLRKWAPYKTFGAGVAALSLLFSYAAHGQESAGAKSGNSAASSPRSPSSSPAASSPETGLSLRVDTTLVQIPVAVTDSQNRFVLGLQKEDFHLLEDGVEQTVAHFSGEDAPLSVGLVFDESGSMDYKLRTSQAAVIQFLKTMNADDEAFLVEFNESAKLSVPFTSHTEEIENALKKAQPGGLTAMLDAVQTALARDEEGQELAQGDRDHFRRRRQPQPSTPRTRSSRWFAKPTCRFTPWACSSPPCLSACPPRRSRDRSCFRRLRRKPAGALSRRRLPATCRASRPESPSNCGINTCSATTRRMRRPTGNTAKWK